MFDSGIEALNCVNIDHNEAMSSSTVADICMYVP